MTSILGCDVGCAEVDGFAVDDTDVDEDVDGLPLTADIGVDAAVTEPNILGASDFIGGTEAGEDDIGADASSIEPKVTDEPVENVFISNLHRYYDIDTVRRKDGKS